MSKEIKTYYRNGFGKWVCVGTRVDRPQVKLPRAKRGWHQRVQTPAGVYPSISEAARAYGIPKASVTYRCRMGFKGWHLLDKYLIGKEKKDQPE